jgi:hypothetical protein
MGFDIGITLQQGDNGYSNNFKCAVKRNGARQGFSYSSFGQQLN